mgnify:CR=1 FL=1
MKEPSDSHSSTSVMLNAPVATLFLRMAMPIILGLLVNGLYAFVDAIFIARAAGTDAIGGVTAAFPIHMILISISAMLGGGMASVLSRKLGAGQDKQASIIFTSSILLASIAGFLISAIIVVFRFDIFTLFNLPAPLLPYALEYITPIASFTFMHFIFTSVSEGFRAEGKNVQVMTLMVLSAVMNILLDALFLLVFEWGVSGAAWATVISIACSLFYGIYLLLQGQHRVRFLGKYFVFIPGIYKEAVLLGLPVFLSYAGFAVMLLAVNMAIINVAAEDAKLLISAYGILNRSYMLIFLPIIGMMIAFQTFAGFNYGALKYKRVAEVLKVALVFSTLYALFWTLIMMLKPEWLFQLFTQDQALIEATVNISKIVFISFMTVGVVMICPALFQALGFAMPSAILNSLHTYILLFPVLCLGSSLYGVEGIWWTFPVIDGLSALIIAIYCWKFVRRLNKGEAEQAMPVATEKLSSAS